jgi:hypothetical protein
VEDDTMDGAEPRQPPDGAQTETERAAESADSASHLQERRALPAPEPAQHRGRHEAPRRQVFGPAGAAIAVVLAAVVLAGVLATRLIGSAEPVAVTTATTAAAAKAGPTSRPPGAGAFGNLVVNWSFEQDLSGWKVVGAADTAREPQGRTSGSCASVRARSPDPGRIGLTLPAVVPSAKRGDRYVASAWVRSTAPGLRVTIRLVGSGPNAEASQATAATLPGLAWRRVIVDHSVAAAAGTDLAVEITADGVPAGDALLLDEVIVRQG